MPSMVANTNNSPLQPVASTGASDAYLHRVRFNSFIMAMEGNIHQVLLIVASPTCSYDAVYSCLVRHFVPGKYGSENGNLIPVKLRQTMTFLNSYFPYSETNTAH